MNDLNRGTAREWYWARVVLIGGFAIAIAAAGYFAWKQHTDAIAAQQAQQQAAIDAQNQSKALSKQAELEAKAKAAIMFCAISLLNAKNAGFIPPYGQLAQNLPLVTKTKGRYACVAGTQVSRYEIASDLVCRNVTDPRCISLYSVKMDDGTVLFQRDKK